MAEELRFHAHNIILDAQNRPENSGKNRGSTPLSFDLASLLEIFEAMRLVQFSQKQRQKVYLIPG